MIKVSQEYKNAMDKRIRGRAYILIGIGAINQKAQKSASISGSFAYWSKGNVFGNTPNLIEYATLEENHLKADGSLYFMPEENDDINIIRANGITTNGFNESVSIELPNKYDIKGITIDFGSTFPTSFLLRTDSETHEYHNDSEHFVSEDVYGEISEITIIPLDMVGGNQRMRIKHILLGVGLEYTNKETKSFSLKEIVSPISDELPSQHVNFSFYDTEDKFNVEDSNSFIDYMETRQTVTTSFGVELEDGSVEWNQISTCYLSELSSQNGIVTISAYDKLYHMEDSYSLGYKIYERTAYDEALSILRDSGLSEDEYYVDEYLKKINLINPMPIGSHKECLQILANACRCKLRPDENGVIMIVPNFGVIVDKDYISIYSNGNAAWGNPENILIGATTVYAELIDDFIKADGSMRFAPEDGEYVQTGYVSDYISDENGDFNINPTLSIDFSEKVSYYGATFEFGGNIPSEFAVRTYMENVLVESVTVTDVQKVTAINHDFTDFDKMVITFTKGAPNSRIILNKMSIGSLSDYVLTRKNMFENPIGYKEKRVKELMVKIYSFQTNENGELEEVEDNVFHTRQINKVGETKALLNPLIATEEHAAMIAEWIGNHYANNVVYDVRYRGDPRLNAADIIRMESGKIDNLQVEITSHSLSFNGAFSGIMEVRRAYNMTRGAI